MEPWVEDQLTPFSFPEMPSHLQFWTRPIPFRQDPISSVSAGGGPAELHGDHTPSAAHERRLAHASHSSA